MLRICNGKMLNCVAVWVCACVCACVSMPGCRVCMCLTPPLATHHKGMPPNSNSLETHRKTLLPCSGVPAALVLNKYALCTCDQIKSLQGYMKCCLVFSHCCSDTSGRPALIRKKTRKLKSKNFKLFFF